MESPAQKRFTWDIIIKISTVLTQYIPKQQREGGGGEKWDLLSTSQPKRPNTICAIFCEIYPNFRILAFSFSFSFFLSLYIHESFFVPVFLPIYLSSMFLPFSRYLFHLLSSSSSLVLVSKSEADFCLLNSLLFGWHFTT